ncbi:MAG: TRAP transporter small permease subunit [Xanthobacteraceae bacterium]|jgi:TRAP-type mannitol/chloroaromatic compound transport system permease small subunit
MPRLAAIADCIDRIIAVIGRIAAWGVLVVVLVEFTVVLLRYGFGIGSIWLQETVVYAHAALFMLAAAWTLAAGGHVRVDIFYARTSARHKAWVDLLGTAFFLLPFMAALLFLSLPYVARSWAILERSRETSGLPLVFVLKTLIPGFATLMLLQGASLAIRAGLTLADEPR